MKKHPPVKHIAAPAQQPEKNLKGTSEPKKENKASEPKKENKSADPKQGAK